MAMSCDWGLVTTVVTMVSAREQTTRKLGGQVRTAETRGETWANDEWLVVVVSHKLYQDTCWWCLTNYIKTLAGTKIGHLMVVSHNKTLVCGVSYNKTLADGVSYNKTLADGVS